MNHSQPGRREDAWSSVILFIITLLSRIPFRSQILYHWDSVNLAYAMREFSVAKEQPQPPGYILYVWLCRAVDLLFGDPQTTMVWISVVASALAVVALFYLGRAMFNRQTGLIAALFLATSPLFWFYGEIALPHSLDMLLVLLGVWWLYETMQGHHRYLYPAIIVVAVAGGVRPQTLVFLAPLILFALRKIGWKRFAIAGALGAAICLAWFIPLVYLSGGINGYLETMGAYTERFNATTSVFMGGGWWGVRRNLIKLSLYTLFGWSVALVPFAMYAAPRVWRREWPKVWEKIFFFTLWLAPTLIFYTIIHMGQQGLTFVFLPALLLWGAHGLTLLLRQASGQKRIALTAVALAINIAIFCFVPQYPLNTDRVRLLTRSALVETDRYYADRLAAIEAGFPAQSTAILTSNWHHVEYYLPAYKLLPIDIIAKWELGEGQVTHAPGQVARLNMADLGLTPNDKGQISIIIFDDALMPLNETPELAQVIELPHGNHLQLLALSADQILYYGQTFGVE